MKPDLRILFRRIGALTIAATALVHASCLPLVEGPDLSLAGQQIRLTLLHTSDIHSRLLPYDFNPLKTDTDLGLIPDAAPFGGATRMAALVRRERAKAGRVLHLDSGDSFQGAPIFNLNLGEVEYKFLTMMGVDAAVIGNHEFDAGAANFTRQLRDSARFPVLAANYVWYDYRLPGNNQTQQYTQPYTVKNIQGLRVAIIGLGNLGSLNSIVERGNSLQILPVEQNEVVRGYVEFLRPSVDLILTVSHAGLTEDQDLIEGYEAYYEWGVAKAYVERENEPWKVIERLAEAADTNKTIVRVQIPGVTGIDAILGGHLHIVLNPPQQLTDPKHRKVLLSHGGAFSKYLLRLDLAVQMPASEADAYEGAELVSHEFNVFPIDSIWCDDAARAYYKAGFWDPGQFSLDPIAKAAKARCATEEDRLTTELLQRYIIDLDNRLSLTTIFAFAPLDIARRNNSTGGDSPLGNITADSMRQRRGVEAEVALTNSLGIRDNLYRGPISQEAMFNVFPFENTINIMFVSGREMQELFDFITERSSTRGCVSQAQVSGARFMMDCGQAVLNSYRTPCDTALNGDDCPQTTRSVRPAWQCLADSSIASGGRCWAHPAQNLTITGKPVQENETYRIAVNDYIARGGSGFLVLKRNTTRIETGIPLRDSLIGYMQNFCSCTDVLAGKRDEAGIIVGKNGQPCGTRDPENQSSWLISDQVNSFCSDTKTYEEALLLDREGCTCATVLRGTDPTCATEERLAACKAALPAGPALGKCSCREALQKAPECGSVGRDLRDLCEHPMSIPIATGAEDGRIQRNTQ